MQFRSANKLTLLTIDGLFNLISCLNDLHGINLNLPIDLTRSLGQLPLSGTHLQRSQQQNKRAS